MMVVSNMLPMLPYASINDMLSHINDSVNLWGDTGAKIFGILVLVVGMIALGQAILDLRKHQPSGMHWLVAILGLLVGGYFLGGIKNFKSVATTQGQDSVNKALDGQG